jgi:hypothetical protein
MNTDTDDTRQTILELCSESEYGCWEFWSTKHSKTVHERDRIVLAITNLVREKKIFPTEYSYIKDQTYKQVRLDPDRLMREVERSRNNDVDREHSYWFLATENGKQEDIPSRSSKP